MLPFLSSFLGPHKIENYNDCTQVYSGEYTLENQSSFTG